MAMAVQQIHPVAHLPLILGVLRRLEVATVIDRLIPPHPAHGLMWSWGRSLGPRDSGWASCPLQGGETAGSAGDVGAAPAGLTRAALNDHRLGHILEALFAANLNKVYSAVALNALEVYAIATPWLHQDTTTIARYGAYADEPKTPGAPRPAYGHSKDGRDDLKQVLLSLGVSGDGGVPVRLGMRDGNRSDSVETPVAIEECLALGCEGVRGIVADSKAYSRRTLGLCLEHGLGLITLVPRTCAVRQELEAWGQQQPGFPLLVESLDGRRTRRRAAGMATVCSAGSRWSIAQDGSPRRNYALSWCIRANWPSSSAGLYRRASEGSRSRHSARQAGASPVVCL